MSNNWTPPTDPMADDVWLHIGDRCYRGKSKQHCVYQWLGRLGYPDGPTRWNDARLIVERGEAMVAGQHSALSDARDSNHATMAAQRATQSHPGMPERPPRHDPLPPV